MSPSQSLYLCASRTFYALDLLGGMVARHRCPNCDTEGGRNPSVLHRQLGLTTVRRCAGCGLLYRPVGLRGGRLLEAYYSLLYWGPGVTSDRNLARDEAALERQMALEGKDRVALVRGVTVPPATICVVGCSWGYELLPLRRAGYEVFGIEISRRRRDFGKRNLGLTIYASVEDAAAHERPDVVLSSHVLEHIPRLSSVLSRISERLAPSVQIHVTPAVEDYGVDRSLDTVMGREHPLGVTRAYWSNLSDQLGTTMDFRIVAGEAICVLRTAA